MELRSIAGSKPAGRGRHALHSVRLDLAYSQSIHGGAWRWVTLARSWKEIAAATCTTTTSPSFARREGLMTKGGKIARKATAPKAKRTKWSDLRAQLSPKSSEKARAMTAQMIAEMPLAELREARRLSQVTLAEALRVKQASVSKLERRTDMYISTLRNVIKAMGGELDIIARFPEGDVRIKQFRDSGAIEAEG